MPDLQRARKTEHKIRRGELPAPTTDAPTLTIGDGSQCDGCGDTIEPREQCSELNVRGVLFLRFHTDCYSAWMHPARD